MKAIVIRLRDVEESETLARECIQSGKQHDLIIYPFDGVYGEEQIAAKHKEFEIRPWKEKMKKNRLGVKGCFLSHYSIWLHAIEIDQPIIVFEHDAVIIRKIPENIEETFLDILNLDYASRIFESYEEYEKYLNVNKSFEVKQIDSTSARATYQYINTHHIKGAHGYILKPNGAKKLIDAAFEHGYIAADVHINSYYLNVNYSTPSYCRINPFFCNKKNVKAFSHTRKEDIV